jgi:serine/threonine-protein kinase
MSPLTMSPDGKRLVYAAYSAGRLQLYVRALDEFMARPLPNTDGAQYPFFSPDGQSLAFFAAGKLKRVSIGGGEPVTICDAPFVGRGGTWGEDDTIVFVDSTALVRVPAGGGRPTRLRTQSPNIDGGFLWPQFLPGGRSLLARVGLSDADARLVVLSLETGALRELGQGSQAQYLPSGHLVFHAPHIREGTIAVTRFDLERLENVGRPVSVLSGVFRSENGGGAYFAVAPTGTLVFAPGGHARTLVRVDRSGRRRPLLDDRLGYRMPKVSPDGRYVAVTIDPRPSQVWVYDLERKSGLPLATGAHSISALWSRDGRGVAYYSHHGIFWRPADGSGEARPLLVREHPQYPSAWTRNGRILIFTNDPPTGRPDIWMLPLGADPHPLIASQASELAGRLSPDDRWLAYMSDESGRFEVYVRPFPNVGDGKWLISTAGGMYPAWADDRRELFYINHASMMSVSVRSAGAVFDAAAPEELFEGPFETGSPQFDVSADGQSFVMVEADPDAKPTRVEVVLNWIEELKRLVP